MLVDIKNSTDNRINLVTIHAPPRSGSTWLQAVLESHPNITTRFQPLFSYQFKGLVNDKTTVEQFDQFVSDLYTTDDPFILSKSEFHIKNGITLPLEKKGDLTTMVMKNVHNHNRLETMIKLSPNIKVIALVRHPCGTVNSYINSKSEYYGDWKTGLVKNKTEDDFWGYDGWKRCVNILMKLKKEYPSNILFVQYERLVENYSLEFQKLFDFIGLNFDSSVVEFINKSRKPSTVKSDYTIYRDSSVSRKWVNSLDPNIIRFILDDVKGTVYETFCV